MARSAASGSSPFHAAARQQLEGHDALLRWAISQGGLAAQFLDLVKDFDLDAEFRKVADGISEKVERLIETQGLSPELASVWREVPKVTFGRSENKLMFDICPGVAQSIRRINKEGDYVYQPVAVCDATVQIFLRSNLQFNLDFEERELRVLEGEPGFGLASPRDALTLTCEEQVLEVVVNCYPTTAPISLAVNDLALLKEAVTERGEDLNTGGNVLFVVEDSTAYQFLRKACNVILHQAGGLAEHDLSALAEWLEHAERLGIGSSATIALAPRRQRVGEQTGSAGPSR